MSRKSKRNSSAYTGQNSVQLVRAGTPYFSLLHNMIAAAKHHIHLQTYIFEGDETGREVATALIAAAKRGVHVYIVADAYASANMSTQLISELQDGGVQFRFFEPLFKSKHFYIGRRLHHKLVVTDATCCMVGGINIGNRYNNMPGEGAWLDFALYAQGPIAQQVFTIACKTWNGFPSKIGLAKDTNMQISIDGNQKGNTMVRLRQNDWVRSKNQISKTYRQMLATSKNHIIFLCSYFMPGNIIKRHILLALKRGVNIKVILAGQSDVAVAKNAERYMYDWLLRNKVEIYEYTGNILHGKLAVCDGEWMTVGSYNVNNISAYASVELNLDVRDDAFTKQVEGVLHQIMVKDCVPITKEQLAKTKSIVKQFIRWCSYEFVRLVVLLFTFYYKQEKRG